MFGSETKNEVGFDGFDLLASDSPAYEFPPLADFPLESKDDLLGILKKRPHSPDAVESLKKSAPKVDDTAAAGDARKVSNDASAQAAALATGRKLSGNLKTEGLATAGDAEKTQTQFVDRWTCDICKSESFDTLEQARSHEAECKRQEASAPAPATSEMLAAGALTSFAVRAVSASTASAAASSANESGSEDGAASDSSMQDTSSYGSRDPSVVIDLVPKGNEPLMLCEWDLTLTMSQYLIAL
jgi:hypothetical protein